MVEVVSLFDEAKNLAFTIAEAPEDAAKSEVVLTCAAKDGAQLVGVRVGLALLNGHRVIHPAAFLSIGEPSDTLVELLRREWRVPDGPRTAAREVRMTAHAIRRPTPSRQGLRFTLKDLRWEIAAFKLICTRPVPKGAPDDFDPFLVEPELELDRDSANLTITIATAQRDHFVQYLSGQLLSGQP